MKLLTELETKYFKDLTSLSAISGNEKEVAHYLIKEYQALGLEIVKDNLGSLYALKRSKSLNPLKVVLDAHMDEVGFIVKEIKENGMIVPFLIGGLNEDSLYSQRIKLISSIGKVFKGAINALPPHISKNSDGNSPLFFDFGFKSKEEVLNAGILYGDMITFDSPFEELENNRILAKALDDRFGLVLGLMMLHELKDIDLPYDLYVGGSVQEEVGLRGIQTINEVIKPDLCIVLDVSTAKDVLSSYQNGAIGEGVLLRFIDRGMIANKALIDFQKEACINTGSKYQYFDALGGTNAGAIHLKNVMTLTHCIVARSIHTSSSIMDLNDYIDAKKSLKYILMNLSKEKFEEFKESRY